MTRQPPSGDAPEMTCGICGQWASNGLHSGDGSGHDFAPSKVFRRRDPAPSGDALREALDAIEAVCSLDIEEMRAQHGSEQRVLLAVIPALVEKARALATPAPPWQWLADHWHPQHTSACAAQPDEVECYCGVGPEYERVLARAYAEQEGGA
jgi:hypothetical protein